MGVVLADVEEAVDAAVDSCREFLRDDVPLVVGVDVEEVALVLGVCLRLIEMTVLADVLLHVAMGVEAVIALQL